MKKVEMYADDDGRVWDSAQKARGADWEIALRELIRSLSGEDDRRNHLDIALRYLIKNHDISLWRLCRILVRLRKKHMALFFQARSEVPY